MVIFGVVIFVRMRFARTDRFEVLGFIEDRIELAFDGRDARCLVVARTAGTAAAATTASARSIIVRFDSGNSINQRFGIQLGI